MTKAEAKQEAEEMKREDPDLRYRVERMPKGDYGILVWGKTGGGGFLVVSNA